MKLPEPSKLNKSFGVRRMDCAGQGYRMATSDRISAGTRAIGYCQPK